MPILPMILPSPDCKDCQYRSLGKFSPDAMTDFNSIGRSFSLPTGIKLNREDVAGDRVLVICSGQVKLSCISKGSRTLHLKTVLPDDVRDLSLATSGSRFEVTEVTAETLAPTSVNIIPRIDLLAFLNRHGAASMNGEKSLAEVQICFLGCSRSGVVRICSWSSYQSFSWPGTVGAA